MYVEQKIKKMSIDFGNDFLKTIAMRVAPVEDVEVQLNRNEYPLDVTEPSKQAVADALLKKDWNRYPNSSTKQLEKIVANYTNMPAESVVLGSGSAHLLTTLFNYFAINRYQLVIADPSFSLFEYHCKTYGIDYQKWPLTAESAYVEDTLPELEDKSAVVLASPNNPTGTVIEPKLIEHLLQKYPKTLFVVDEVYFEFYDKSSASLVSRFDNIAVVRSLSKAFGVAGVRIGYLLANANLAALVRKLILPFSLNYLSVSLLEVLFANDALVKSTKENIAKLMQDKLVVCDGLQKKCEELGFSLVTGEANFVLLKFESDDKRKAFLRVLTDNGIGVLDLSMFPRMEDAVRITIGSEEENAKLLQVVNKIPT